MVSRCRVESDAATTPSAMASSTVRPSANPTRQSDMPDIAPHNLDNHHPAMAGRRGLQAIDGVDLQACGGTHVAQTAEIGRVECTKVENKGKMNRRFIISLL